MNLERMGACPINALSKELLCSIELRDNEVAIVDADAGIEHFGRGVDQCADIILAVIDPSYESIKLAGKISELGESIDYFPRSKTYLLVLPSMNWR